MRFNFSHEEKKIQSEIRAFISLYVTEEVIAAIKTFESGNPPSQTYKDFFGKVVEGGWTAVSWPKEYGGQGRSQFAQFIVEEEFQRVGLRIGGGGTGAPAILASGTETQKQQYIPGTIRHEIIFAQGFSEPQCGNDLAGVKCKATREGDKYIISGQKLYTSAAHYATHLYLLVRTDPTSRRQAGLSVLLIPMGLPGITIRPLWTLQNDPPAPPGTTYGDPRTNEVFFDQVEAPISSLLGQEGDGWNVARRGLNLDRVGARRYLMSVQRDEDVVNWLKSDHKSAALLSKDPAVWDAVADLWIGAQVCRLMTYRSVAMVERDVPFSYEGAAEKVWAPEHGLNSTETISQILGPYAQLLNGSPAAVSDGIFAHNLQGAFQSTVNHGSIHVMRDQIARRGLGMPRQPN
jgi:3-oxocholest-4-en-26-oyl-CoA dehydrogenase alpha subunit